IRYSVVPVPLMPPLNCCVTVALVTFGPPAAPAGFSFQSLISKSPLASNVDPPSRRGVADGAGDGNRTHVNSLEGCRTTIVLRPLLRLRPGSPEGIRTPDLDRESVAY